MTIGARLTPPGAQTMRLLQESLSAEARARLRTLVARRFAASVETARTFFAAEADHIAHACQAMAARFDRGGRLLVFGDGASASDAQHVAVEFVHPVLVGKRALPAIALTDGDPSPALRTVGRESDIAMAITTAPGNAAHAKLLEAARDAGMLTISVGLTRAAAMADARNEPRGSSGSVADFVFNVPSEDQLIAQEVHETLYHVLWELVHVFLEAGPRP
jgi:D-sedoheptulose 7-phosphate isomerase